MIRPFLYAAALLLASPAFAQTFHICTPGENRHTASCVVDGDTLWYNGSKIRMEHIDAPEVENYDCPAEKALGDKATARLTDLLNAGGWTLQRDGNRERDKYGRFLLTLHTASGTIEGEMISEGLAHPYDGKGKRPGWCE